MDIEYLKGALVPAKLQHKVRDAAIGSYEDTAIYVQGVDLVPNKILVRIDPTLKRTRKGAVFANYVSTEQRPMLRQHEYLLFSTWDCSWQEGHTPTYRELNEHYDAGRGMIFTLVRSREEMIEQVVYAGARVEKQVYLDRRFERYVAKTARWCFRGPRPQTLAVLLQEETLRPRLEKIASEEGLTAVRLAEHQKIFRKEET